MNVTSSHDFNLRLMIIYIINQYELIDEFEMKYCKDYLFMRMRYVKFRKTVIADGCNEYRWVYLYKTLLKYKFIFLAFFIH